MNLLRAKPQVRGQDVASGTLVHPLKCTILSILSCCCSLQSIAWLAYITHIVAFQVGFSKVKARIVVAGGVYLLDGGHAACCSASHHKGGDVGNRLVSISQPSFVTSNVCSNCALLLPSWVTAVHSSGQWVSCHTPALIMGSTENVMPSRMIPLACTTHAPVIA